jgi:hypothetical protein
MMLLALRFPLKDCGNDRGTVILEGVIEDLGKSVEACFEIPAKTLRE